MKTASIYLVLAALFFASCKEEPPGINYKPDATVSDTTYITNEIPTPQLKEVLLEDISGVKCVNCPEAATIAANIQAANPGRVNVINTQPGTKSLKTLCEPINDVAHVSKYDFRTEVATNILTAVATPGSLPSGFIDRKVFSGKLDAVVPREEWVSSVGTQLSVPTPVNIKISGTYNASTKELTADVELIYTALESDSDYLSIAIIEDSIIDAQETKDPNNGATIFIDDYVHRHVLLDMMTAATGDLINKTNQITLTPGRVIKKRFISTITPHADAKHLGIVAYVHRGPSSKYYVLQSKIAEVE